MQEQNDGLDEWLMDSKWLTLGDKYHDRKNIGSCTHI